MKAYKIVLLVVDHDNLGGDGVISNIENVRYPNRCLSPSVLAIQQADIGEWHDGHALNHRDTEAEEIDRLPWRIWIEEQD